MCGRYRQSRDPTALRDIFQSVNPLANIRPSWNIAPTQDAAIIRAHPDGGRHLDLLRWGLVPHWARDASGAARTINARAETLWDKPTFRESVAKRRCLVPADGFYEWHGARADGRKQAWAITPSDARPMAFAGLWSGWRAPGGGIMRSFAIVTTAANAALRPLHERMPVMLPPEAWGLWLDQVAADRDALAPILRGAFTPATDAWAVGPRVGSVREDDAGLVTRDPSFVATPER